MLIELPAGRKRKQRSTILWQLTNASSNDSGGVIARHGSTRLVHVTATKGS